MAMIFFLAISLLLQGALGDLVCEEVPVGMCSFSISSTGKRCTLETGDQTGEFQCKTSEVFVNSIREHIESDECISACGVDRNVVGISSDFLLESQFTAKLCSKHCLNNCPNIVDLYSNLALAEGVLLPKLCKDQETNPRRAMSQISSSGVADTPRGQFSFPRGRAAAFGPTYAVAAAGPASLPWLGRELYSTDVAEAPAPAFLIRTAWESEFYSTSDAGAPAPAPL
ncbi:hypothetical protein ACH5RR_010155 [Cinchona calisaya]|uniref:PAR1 protein n=1 Tax=Cinchona calisaya TaxID=153742 RepID=A0ABD3AGX0_9GENT